MLTSQYDFDTLTASLELINTLNPTNRRNINDGIPYNGERNSFIDVDYDLNLILLSDEDVLLAVEINGPTNVLYDTGWKHLFLNGF